MSEANQTVDTETWEPRIVAFLCNWCSYAGADLAGMSRLGYPAAIKIIRLPCSGRVDPMFILKSFERGADMVLVSGCHPGDCHYSSGNYHARRKLTAFHELISFLGIDPRRFKISWVSAAEGSKWSSLVTTITEEAYALGPYDAFPKCEFDDLDKRDMAAFDECVTATSISEERE